MLILADMVELYMYLWKKAIEITKKAIVEYKILETSDFLTGIGGKKKYPFNTSQKKSFTL